MQMSNSEQQTAIQVAVRSSISCMQSKEPSASGRETAMSYIDRESALGRKVAQSAVDMLAKARGMLKGD